MSANGTRVATCGFFKDRFVTLLVNHLEVSRNAHHYLSKQLAFDVLLPTVFAG
jgi:hypothetical protein